MSHKTTMKVEIKDLATLKKCLTDLGYTHEASVDGKNSMRTKSSYSGANDDVCLRLTGYTNGKTNQHIASIGFRREKDGTIKATGDFWRIQDAEGKGVSADSLARSLKTRYTVRNISREMNRQGFAASKNGKGTNVDTDGKIRMVFTRS